MKKLITNILPCFVGFVLGASVLVLFSAIQKLSAGYPLHSKGFVVPLFFGGVVGVLLCKWRGILKDKQRRLYLSQQKALESDRLKDSFLKNLSHEIRTPMNAICGFSEMLDQPHYSEEDKQYFIKNIQNGSYKLLDIVNDILTISTIASQQQVVSKQPTPVNPLLNALYDAFKATADEKKLNFILSLPPDNKPVELLTDSTKLKQILSHLLSNAFKFTQKGSIEMGYGIKKSGAILEFFVKDTGMGIQADAHDLIFERFRHANPSISENYGGSGLGLAIAKGFVELLGGNIRVESEYGQGAAFYFTLPYQNLEIRP
jgi:signal transduction histidine kinase